MRTQRLLPILLAALVASSCVSLGTHEELMRSHDEVKASLATNKAGLATCEQELAQSKERETKLRGALEAAQQRAAALDLELAAAEADKRATQSELAQVVKDRSALKSSVEEMKAALEEATRRKAEAERRIGEYRALLARFKTLIDAGKLRVKMVDGRMVVQLSSDILFASGSAALSKDGKTNVIEVARVLADIPGRKFQVEGHTDNVPIRTEQFPSNWELASARALNVVRAMTDGGLTADRVSAASFADTKPAAPNDTTDGKAQNRRIEIVVVPDLSSLPGFEELQKAGG